MMAKKEAVKLLNEFEHYLTNGNPIWKTEDVAQAFDIALTALGKDDDVIVHCNVKENAELIARILDYDADNEAFPHN